MLMGAGNIRHPGPNINGIGQDSRGSYENENVYEHRFVHEHVLVLEKNARVTPGAKICHLLFVICHDPGNSFASAARSGFGVM